jgi:Ca-activated chloride channel family protein
VAVPATGLVDVTVTTSLPLGAHGTLSGIVLPIDWARPPAGTVDVKVHATSEAPLRALYSPYHELTVLRDGVREAHAAYSGRGVCPDFDLTLLTSSGDGPVRLDMLPFRYGAAEGGTFLALVTPDPTPIAEDVLPRDVVFIVDTSGSMSGVKLAQAKEALHGVLGGLRPADTFALISFSDAVRAFQPQAAAASADTVASALAFVDGLQATGGTNIYDALAAGFAALPRETGHPRYVVFLTDGQPTTGTTSIDAIAAMAQTSNDLGARLFAFGIGDDVNTVLLDRLAHQSSGDVFYVRPSQSVSVAVQAFFDRLSDPVLANPTLDLGAFGATKIYPEVLPDLFAGRTVTVFGRYTGPGRGTVTLTGQRAGQSASVAFDVTLPEFALADGYVPRVWAARHVGRLLAAIKAGDTDPALVEEVRAVAARYGVTTNFTSFVAGADGNVALQYSPVPVVASGSLAVDTSSALNGYGQSETVRAAAPAPNQAPGQKVSVSYVGDRTLALQDGYLTDTKLAGAETAVELIFGSERYFAFAAGELPWGAGGLLAAGPNARFELLGRAFRVTDPAALPTGVTEPPPESSVIPDPAWRPNDTSAAVGPPLGDGGAIVDAGEPPPVPEPPGLAHDRSGCACRLADTHAGPGPAVWLALAALAAARRRRRPSWPDVHR